MPDFNVIADVSRTLESVRSAGFSTLLPNPPPVAEVHDLQGNISINPARLTLFLLEVTWSGDRFTDHQILGRTLQVLYDGAILSGPQLVGNTLQNTSVALKITLTPIMLEERSRVFFVTAALPAAIRVVNLPPAVSPDDRRHRVRRATVRPHASTGVADESYEPTVLLPAATYPFAPYLAVLRGQVEDINGNPVPDVLVQEGMRERTLTYERGAFSLSLRWVKPGVQTAINVSTSAMAATDRYRSHCLPRSSIARPFKLRRGEEERCRNT